MKSTYSNNKTILITGGTGGIGSSLVRILREQGYNVAITGRNNSTMLSELKKEFGLEVAEECDAIDRSKMKHIVNKVVDTYGSIDGLVNCAGITKSVPFLEIDVDTAIEEYKVNVLGTIIPIQETVNIMLKNKTGGRIVNISSLRGVPMLASPRSITYSMSKSAIISLTSSLAKKYGPEIIVNCVAPGFTQTSMSSGWAPSTWKDAKDNNIYKRPAKPPEIAEFISFMLSEKCNYMTGQTILVDGGFLAFNT